MKTLFTYLPSLSSWQKCFEAHRPFIIVPQNKDQPSAAESPDLEALKLETRRALDEASEAYDKVVRTLCDKFSLDVEAIWLNVDVLGSKSVNAPLFMKMIYWLEKYYDWNRMAVMSDVRFFIDFTRTAYTRVIQPVQETQGNQAASKQAPSNHGKDKEGGVGTSHTLPPLALLNKIILQLKS